MKQCCGNCKWWQSPGFGRTLGDCVWADLNLPTPILDALLSIYTGGMRDFDRETSADYGRDCHAYKPKEDSNGAA